MPRVKRLAANHLSNSWSTIPHVTHHDEADITELEDFRAKLTDPVSGDKIKIIKPKHHKIIYEVMLLDGFEKNRTYFVITEDLLKDFVISEEKNTEI